MKREKRVIKLYDGANNCEDCDQCPVVDYFPKKRMVKISDPAKPENGQFVMTVEEYNALIANSKKII